MDGVVVEEKRREYVIYFKVYVHVYIYIPKYMLYYESIKMLFRDIYIYYLSHRTPQKHFCKNAPFGPI
jgi:hypothetical protein